MVPFAATAALITAPLEARPTPPAGFRLTSRDLAGSLPASIALEPTLRLVLAAQSGEIGQWLDNPKAGLVRDLAAEAQSASRREDRASLPLRLFLVEDGRLLGVIQPVVGRRQLVDARTSGNPRGRLEVRVLELVVNAGSLQGPGDVGSRIVLAWRSLGKGSAAFEAPVASAGAQALAGSAQTVFHTKSLSKRLASSPGSTASGTPAGGLNWRLLLERA